MLKEWISTVRPWSIPATAIQLSLSCIYLCWRGTEINLNFGLWQASGLIMLLLAGAGCSMLNRALRAKAASHIIIFLTFAILPAIWASYVLTGIIDWSVLIATLPSYLIADGTVLAHHSRSMGISRKTRARIYGFEMLFPYAWTSIFSMTGLLPFHTIMIFITIPGAIGCAKSLNNAVTGGSSTLIDIDTRTSSLQMIFSTMMAVSLLSAMI